MSFQIIQLSNYSLVSVFVTYSLLFRLRMMTFSLSLKIFKSLIQFNKRTSFQHSAIKHNFLLSLQQWKRDESYLLVPLIHSSMSPRYSCLQFSNIHRLLSSSSPHSDLQILLYQTKVFTINSLFHQPPFFFFSYSLDLIWYVTMFQVICCEEQKTFFSAFFINLESIYNRLQIEIRKRIYVTSFAV